MIDVIKSFSELPPYVMIDNKEYSPVIMRSGTEVRFCYSTISGEHLYLYEDIDSDSELYDIMRKVSGKIKRIQAREELKKKRREARKTVNQQQLKI